MRNLSYFHEIKSGPKSCSKKVWKGLTINDPCCSGPLVCCTNASEKLEWHWNDSYFFCIDQSVWVGQSGQVAPETGAKASWKDKTSNYQWLPAAPREMLGKREAKTARMRSGHACE